MQIRESSWKGYRCRNAYSCVIRGYVQGSTISCQFPYINQIDIFVSSNAFEGHPTKILSILPSLSLGDKAHVGKDISSRCFMLPARNGLRGDFIRILIDISIIHTWLISLVFPFWKFGRIFIHEVLIFHCD